MASELHAYELPALGIRVFYQVPDKKESAPGVYYSHKHPYYELHILRSGCMSFQVGEKTHTLTEGDFCLVYPGTVHVPAQSHPDVIRGSLSFELTDADCGMGDLLTQKCRIGDCYCGKSEAMAGVWHFLQNEAVNSPFSEEMICALLAQLMIHMARVMQSTAVQPAADAGSLDQLRSVYIDTFLNNRFFLPGGESVLAEELGVSRRQLERIFQKLYGKSYREKLLEVRAEAACELLKEDLPIQEIAERIGYGSSSNFTAFFKGIYGITPSQYRRTNRQKL